MGAVCTILIFFVKPVRFSMKLLETVGSVLRHERRSLYVFMAWVHSTLSGKETGKAG